MCNRKLSCNIFYLHEVSFDSDLRLVLFGLEPLALPVILQEGDTIFVINFLDKMLLANIKRVFSVLYAMVHGVLCA